MKSIFKNFGIVLIFFMFSNGYGMEMTDASKVEVVSTFLIKKKRWTGSWDYLVQDVPLEYSSGILHVSKKKKVYTVELEMPGGKLPADNVKVSKNKLTFSVDIEGSMVEVALIMDGDSFEGESYTPDGTFILVGNRRI
ncbi:hypothetical protein [Eudoraea adriatica]|uniref:hypothetical protein n=1 Tax=Eudoraea adriatica TaxID=446681 RepID=UPI0012F80E4A|nr:hypothetical protein [Eudoraea adriatica]